MLTCLLHRSDNKLLFFKVHEKCLLSTYQQKIRDTESATVDQCCACNKFFREEKSLHRHLNSCIHMPGILRKIKNQNKQTFFDNIKFMGDVPCSMYFNLRSLVPKNFATLTKMLHSIQSPMHLWLHFI